MTKTCLIVTALLLVSTQSAANEWVMPGLTTQWIARDMDLNGLPASMRAISGQRPLSDVLRYYRDEWSGAIDERQMGEWHVLSTRQRDRFASLRIRARGGGVEGVLTTSVDPAVALPDLSSRLPVPPGLKPLARQRFRDSGSQGENLTLMSPRSVAYERQAFASLYATDGWTVAEDRPTQTVPDGQIMQFLRGKEQVRIVLYRDPDLAAGRTLILVTSHRD